STVLLLDSVSLSPYAQDFLKSFRPEAVLPVGSFPAGKADLEKRLGVPVAPAVAWNGDGSAALWQTLFPRAERVVLSPATPRRLLLQAASLAGALQAPLLVTPDQDEAAAALQRRLKQ